MKVLHITHLYPRPYDPLLGIAMHKQIKALELQGCVNKVISPTAWAPFPIKYLSSKWKSYSQVPIHVILEGIEAYYPRYVSFPKALLLALVGFFFASISSSSIMAFNPQWLLFAFALAFLNWQQRSQKRWFA
ncbi:MAG: teichuronic acid biosynthesis glycosyltransferase TuaC [Candidatus Atribacteria bacterium]|nr:teichuronic acid biosynthesis glycosyltransferase TuaC [Candidatus Atribacteria bacterium]